MKTEKVKSPSFQELGLVTLNCCFFFTFPDPFLSTIFYREKGGLDLDGL